MRYSYPHDWRITYVKRLGDRQYGVDPKEHFKFFEDIPNLGTDYCAFLEYKRLIPEDIAWNVWARIYVGKSDANTTPENRDYYLVDSDGNQIATLKRMILCTYLKTKQPDPQDLEKYLTQKRTNKSSLLEGDAFSDASKGSYEWRVIYIEKLGDRIRGTEPRNHYKFFNELHRLGPDYCAFLQYSSSNSPNKWTTFSRVIVGHIYENYFGPTVKNEVSAYYFVDSDGIKFGAVRERIFTIHLKNNKPNPKDFLELASIYQD